VLGLAFAGASTPSLPGFAECDGYRLAARAHRGPCLDPECSVPGLNSLITSATLPGYFLCLLMVGGFW